MRKIPSALLLLAVIPACDGDKSISLSDFRPRPWCRCSRAARCGLVPDKARACGFQPRHRTAISGREGRKSQVRWQGGGCLPGRPEVAELQLLGPGGQAELQACREVSAARSRPAAFATAGGVISGDCGGELCSGSGFAQCVQPQRQFCGSGSDRSDCSQDIAGCVDGDSAAQFYAADLPGEGCCGSALRCSSGSEECVAGTYCVASSASTGTCGTPPAEGQTCYPSQVGLLAIPVWTFAMKDPEVYPQDPAGGACPWGIGCVDYAICSSTGMCVAKGRAVTQRRDPMGGCLGSLDCYSGHAPSRPPRLYASSASSYSQHDPLSLLCHVSASLATSNVASARSTSASLAAVAG